MKLSKDINPHDIDKLNQNQTKLLIDSFQKSCGKSFAYGKNGWDDQAFESSRKVLDTSRKGLETSRKLSDAAKKATPEAVPLHAVEEDFQSDILKALKQHRALRKKEKTKTSQSLAARVTFPDRNATNSMDEDCTNDKGGFPELVYDDNPLTSPQANNSKVKLLPGSKSGILVVSGESGKTAVGKILKFKKRNTPGSPLGRGFLSMSQQLSILDQGKSLANINHERPASSPLARPAPSPQCIPLSSPQHAPVVNLGGIKQGAGQVAGPNRTTTGQASVTRANGVQEHNDPPQKHVPPRLVLEAASPGGKSFLRVDSPTSPARAATPQGETFSLAPKTARPRSDTSHTPLRTGRVRLESSVPRMARAESFVFETQQEVKAQMVEQFLERERTNESLINQWVENYEREQQQFNSPTVFAEVRLKEYLHELGPNPSPNPVQTAICCDLLLKMASQFGRYGNLMEILSGQILTSIYPNYPAFASQLKAKEKQVNAKNLFKLPPFYLDADKISLQNARNSQRGVLLRAHVKYLSAKLKEETLVIRNVAFKVWKKYHCYRASLALRCSGHPTRKYFAVWKMWIQGRERTSKHKFLFKFFQALKTPVIERKRKAEIDEQTRKINELLDVVLQNSQEQIGAFQQDLKQREQKLQTIEGEVANKERLKLLVTRALIQTKKQESQEEIKYNIEVACQTDFIDESNYKGRGGRQTGKGKKKSGKRPLLSKKMKSLPPDPCKVETPPIPLESALNIIPTIYRDRFLIKPFKLHPSLRDFTRAQLIRRYGIESLATKYFKGLISCLHANETNDRIKVFAGLFGEIKHKTPVMITPMHLSFLDKIFEHLTDGDLKTIPGMFSGQAKMIETNVFREAAKKAFPTYTSDEKLMQNLDYKLQQFSTHSAKSTILKIDVDKGLFVLMGVCRHEEIASQSSKQYFKALLLLQKTVKRWLKSKAQQNKQKHLLTEYFVQECQKLHGAKATGMLTFDEFEQLVKGLGYGHISDEAVVSLFLFWNQEAENIAESKRQAIFQHSERVNSAEMLQMGRKRTLLLTHSFDAEVDMNQAKALEDSRGIQACKLAFAKVMAENGFYMLS